MIKFFKNKKKEKLAKEKLAQQQVQANQNDKTQSAKPQVSDQTADKNLNQQQINPSQTHAPSGGQAPHVPAEKPMAEKPLEEQITAQPAAEPSVIEKTNTEQAVQTPAVDQGVDNPAVDNAVSSNALDAKLEKSNKNFGKKMKQLFSFKKKIDEDLFEDIETTLLMADVGATATMDVMEKVRKSVKRKNLSDSDAVYDALKIQLNELATKVEQPLVINEEKQPFVILVVGVNGVGKTTTIAKLAKKFKNEGKNVMLAAGDTFRAAAVEQLKTWGAREDIPVMAQNTGADSASVIFDAMTSAKAKGMDVLIADTAGRLHTQANLMQELEKIGRVMKKNDETAPHETLIVVDGGTGQNAISQVREFNKAGQLSGIVITKLDGTAKGGVLFNLAAEFGIPVRYIGVGEQSSDLKPYQAKDFVAAIIE